MTEENLTNKDQWRERIIRYAPLFLWIGLIFFASTENGSMNQTSRFVRPFLVWLFPNAPEEIITAYHALIRKCAHFTEYGILAFWACPAFANSAKPFLQKYWFVISLLLILLISLIDETNQSFESSRTGSVRDVLLDCAGGATIVLIFFINRVFQKKKHC